jgi:hypothetical protein
MVRFQISQVVARFATGIITQIVAGHRITSNDDPYLRLSDMITQAITEMGPPGGSPLDFFPIRENVDGIVHSQTRSMLYSPVLPSLVPWSTPCWCCQGLEIHNARAIRLSSVHREKAAGEQSLHCILSRFLSHRRKLGKLCRRSYLHNWNKQSKAKTTTKI